MKSDSRIEALLEQYRNSIVKPTIEQLCQKEPALIPQLRQAITLELARGVSTGTGDLKATLDPALPAADGTPAVKKHDPPDWSKPRIEGFELIRPLGAGGMGVVWLAKQLATQRDVAVKLLSSSLIGSELAQLRFQREVELAANLDHPAIATIYESGVNRGIFYYAMEYVQGVPLDDYVKQHSLSPRQILELLTKICSGVQHAHQRGVMHRDLKPSNILVTDEGQPKLLDFGLARVAEGNEPGVTASNLIAGTPGYMSPEQAKGELKTIDTRTDVYSLGVILYELLSGKLPHLPKDSTYELLQRIIETDAAPLRSQVPEVDSELNAVVMKALSRDRKGRYGSAGALQEDLRRYLDGFAVSARPQTAWYLAKKWVLRHRLAVASTMLGLLAVIAATIGYIVNIRAEQARTLAAKINADQERDRAVGFAGESLEQQTAAIRTIRDVLSRAQQLQATSTTIPAEFGPILDAAMDGAARLQRASQSTPQIDYALADCWVRSAELLLKQNQKPRAMTQYTQAATIARDEKSLLPPVQRVELLLAVIRLSLRLEQSASVPDDLKKVEYLLERIEDRRAKEFLSAALADVKKQLTSTK